MKDQKLKFLCERNYKVGCFVMVVFFIWKPDQVWLGLVSFKSFFYCFRNESFAFFNRSGKPCVGPKTFQVKTVQSWSSGRGDWHHNASANQTHCLHMTVSHQIMVLICSYLLIILVLCILLCVKIIVQVFAFINLLASTFVYWENIFVGQKVLV